MKKSFVGKLREGSDIKTLSPESRIRDSGDVVIRRYNVVCVVRDNVCPYSFYCFSGIITIWMWLPLPRMVSFRKVLTSLSVTARTASL